MHEALEFMDTLVLTCVTITKLGHAARYIEFVLARRAHCTVISAYAALNKVILASRPNQMAHMPGKSPVMSKSCSLETKRDQLSTQQLLLEVKEFGLSRTEDNKLKFRRTKPHIYLSVVNNYTGPIGQPHHQDPGEFPRHIEILQVIVCKCSDCDNTGDVLKAACPLEKAVEKVLLVMAATE
ncbi:hypothetical protein RRG08_027912 [Elysia crispata]|uniref:Uncharacterized protein n=1 Tax=Elysia crispata TaxID=231223 RepID=A0AAE1A6T9_9GAST|nr:hypothetical protein RRG08_027912 [Elysia crispata]